MKSIYKRLIAAAVLGIAAFIATKKVPTIVDAAFVLSFAVIGFLIFRNNEKAADKIVDKIKN